MRQRWEPLHTALRPLRVFSRRLRREQPLLPVRRPRKALRQLRLLLEQLQGRQLQQRPAIPAQQIRHLIFRRITRSLTQELNSILRRLNKTFLSRLRVQGLQNK